MQIHGAYSLFILLISYGELRYSKIQSQLGMVCFEGTQHLDE